MSLITKPASKIPLLVDGDRLTATEFHRRYEAMPEDVRAELIEGVVYIMSSPVKFEGHGDEHLRLGWAFKHYTVFTPGVRSGGESTVQLDDYNEPQPDLLMFIGEESGGQSKITEKGYIEGAPELVAEISNSSADYDLNAKFRVYQKCKAKEYVVWRVEDEEILWFALADDRFVRLAADANGVYKSPTFPGLWLDAPALLRDDAKAVLAVLSLGLASPEHAAFVDKLAAAKRPV